RFIRAQACEKRSASDLIPFIKMTRTRVKAPPSSLLYGGRTSSFRVNRCFSSGVPLSFNRSSAITPPEGVRLINFESHDILQALEQRGCHATILLRRRRSQLRRRGAASRGRKVRRRGGVSLASRSS